MKEEAVAVATADAGGFLGTWVRAALLVYKAANSDDIALVGTAVDSPDGAVLQTEASLRVRVAKLAAWPAKVRGRPIAAAGRLRLITDPTGEQGHLLLERATCGLRRP